MSESMYHPTTPEQAQRRKELAPGVHDAFQSFSNAVFADGALPQKTKQLIAVAVAHVTQCPYCINGHTKLAIRKGNTPRRSWRRSGSPQRCEPGVLSPTRPWPWMPSRPRSHTS
jgi:AhpD family alkylhydroperoxidase